MRSSTNRALIFGEVVSEPVPHFLDDPNNATRYEAVVRTEERWRGKVSGKDYSEVNEFRIQLSGDLLNEVRNNMLYEGQNIVVEGLFGVVPWTDEHGNKRYCQELFATSIIETRNNEVMGKRHTRSSISMTGKVTNDMLLKHDAKGQEIGFTSIRVEGRPTLGLLDFFQDIAVFHKLVAPAKIILTKGTWVYIDGRLNVHGLTPSGDDRVQIVPIWLEALR